MLILQYIEQLCIDLSLTLSPMQTQYAANIAPACAVSTVATATCCCCCCYCCYCLLLPLLLLLLTAPAPTVRTAAATIDR